MTTSEVYWLTRLDGINTLLLLLCFGSLIIAFLLSLVSYLHADTSLMGEEEESAKNFAKRALKLGLLTALLTGSASVFVPTTKELIAIYGISYLTQNKDAREIPAEALKVLNQKLKEMESE